MVSWSDGIGFLAVLGIGFGIGFGIVMGITTWIIILVEFPNQVGLLFIDGEWKWVALLNLQQWLYILGKGIIPSLIGGGIGCIIAIMILIKR